MGRAPLVVVMLSLGACQVESCKPGEVGVGIARLTVRNAAMTTKLVDADPACGFSSPAVLANPILEGLPGAVGSATWKISNCTLTFSKPTTALKDCNNIETTATGTVTVSGTKTVKGVLTGNPKNPVIPITSDAARFELQATYEKFVARTSNSKNALTITQGKLSWAVEPRIAVSASKGVCAVATPNATLSDVKYENATVFLESPDRQFSADVQTSAFSAQAGKRGEKENWIGGGLTVFGDPVTFPAVEDTQGLDPEYDSAMFTKSYSCLDDLKQPLSFECPSLNDRIAQGSAALTVSLFGRLVDYLDDETTCGFASAGVTGHPTLTGKTGERGGSVTYNLSSCTLTFAQPTAVKTDCFGATTYFTGTVSVSGSKKVNGILTGDPAQPVIPTSRDPALVNVTFDLSNFKITDSVSTRELSVQSGSLGGTLAVRTALDTALGACAIKTPVATIGQLTWSNAKLVLGNDGNAFPLTVSSSALEAQNGTKDGKSNFFAGTMVIDGKQTAIPTDKGAPILDPDFEQTHFDGTFACLPRIKIPATEEECAFVTPLAEGAARLLIQSVGTLGGLVNKDTACGFGTTTVLLAPSQVVGSAGQMGSMSWKINQCTLGSASGPLTLDHDCLGTRSMLSGTATINAERTVTGLREKQLLIIDSIVPVTREAVVVTLSSMLLHELASYTIASGMTGPAARLTIHSGMLSAVVKPVLGERTSKPGTFDVPTPIASLTEVTLTNAKVTLESGAKQFAFLIPTAHLNAFNGSFKGSTNSLSGSLQLDGTTVTLPAMPLNPDFTQASLDSSYACTADLKSVVPPNGP